MVEYEVEAAAVFLRGGLRQNDLRKKTGGVLC
jgi:hypothetical protein